MLEFPGSVDGPWARYVHGPDARGIGTVRYPRLVARDDACSAKLAKRTLTDLHNERPAWLDLAHRKLDEAVFAADNGIGGVRKRAHGGLYGSMKILVVDDDEDIRGLLEVHLRRWGHEPVSAADGKEALAALELDRDISLVITDWMMPGANGLEVCRGVRRMAAGRYLPVVLLTARSGKQALVEGLDAGADAFLSKPLDAAELQAQLRVFERVAALERQVQAAAEREAQARELRAVLATARLITDRINNPMLVIQMQSEILRSLSGAASPEKLVTAAERMLAAVARVSECVHQLEQVVRPVIDERPSIGPVLNIHESTSTDEAA